MINSARHGSLGRSPSQRLLTRAAVATISGYQRYLSPHKGFSCAYRIHHDGESCSQYAKRVLEAEGLRGFGTKLRARFAECRESHLALRAMAKADGVRFGEVSWLPGVGHGLIEAGTWCIPTPFGCCFVSK